MKSLKLSLLLTALLLGSSVGNMAWADRGHGHAHVGIYVGTPLFWPWYYPAPSYYGPGYYPYYAPYYAAPTVVESPPVYIEQTTVPPPSPKSSNAWYYCNNPDGYYPYVKECPTGWQKVAPQP